MILDIDPCAKPRMTRSDKWKKRPAVLKYRAFCDLLNWTLHVNHLDDLDLNSKHIIFIISMPKSWSKKKKASMASEPHTQKPDLDNLLKALFDAIYGDDSHIHTIHASKMWGWHGAIHIDS
jgi:Holliday junction resolvase RusA-like endonuclease